MSAEEATVIPHDQAGGPPVSAATSVAEIPAPNPPEKREEGNAEQAEQATSKPAEVPNGPRPPPPMNGGREEVAPTASHEETKTVPAEEPAELAQPAAVAAKETNGSAAKPADIVSGAATAEPEPAKGATQKDESAATAPVPAANGQSQTEEDAEMKEAPALAATATETATQDGAPAPAPVANKRKAEDALAAEADGNVKEGGEKKAKTVAEEDALEPTDAEAKPAVETNGASTAPPALAKKGGRPKKQARAAAPVGRTERKTRSQGPVEV